MNFNPTQKVAILAMFGVIANETYGLDRVALNATTFIPMQDGVQPWQSAWGYKVVSEVGMAAFIADYADDLPPVARFLTPKSVGIKTIGDSYAYSEFELQQWLATKVDLSRDDAETARRKIDEKVDDVLLMGDEGQGVTGLFNNENVTVVESSAGASGQTDFENKTYKEIVAQFRAVFAAQKNLFKDKKVATAADWIFLIGLSLIVSVISQKAGALINNGLCAIGLDMFGSATCTTVFVTVLGLICAMTPIGKLAAVEELSSVYLYAVVSLLASRASLVDLVAAPMWIVYGMFILLIHVITYFILSKIFKWDLCMVSTASLANIGGSASAPIVATAYNPNFAGIGVLMGVLGAAIGNFCGLGMGAILQIFVK